MIDEEIISSMRKRMLDTNDYIVKGCSAYYWANTDQEGCLIEGLTFEEIEAMFYMEQTGELLHETHSRS